MDFIAIDSLQSNQKHSLRKEPLQKEFFLPRPPRLEYPGAFYHVYNRGNRKEKIFHSTRDYQLFEEFLIEGAEMCQVGLYAWCLMPNHFHLLIETPLGNMSNFMRRLLTRYAVHFNLRHELVGHVFQSRYKAAICDKESYFMELVRYIHMNPLRAKTPLVADLNDWRWSSHRYYVSGGGPDLIRRTARSYFGGCGFNDVYSPRLYLAFLRQKNVKEETPDGFSPNGRQFLGDDQFVEQVKKEVDNPINIQTGQLKPMANCWALRNEVIRWFGVSPEDLEGPSRQMNLNKIRRAFVFVGRRHYRFSSGELGRCLKRDISAISHIIFRHGAGLENTPEVKKLIGLLKVKS